MVCVCVYVLGHAGEAGEWSVALHTWSKKVVNKDVLNLQKQSGSKKIPM